MTERKIHSPQPSQNGKFGRFGGRYIPETLITATNDLISAYERIKSDPDFIYELDYIRKTYAGRPTPLTYAKNLSKKYNCKIYLKREDLLHGGAHKLNNTMAQALIAKKMGKTKLIAETGAGQHGFATAIAGAFFNMKTTVYMGSVDVRRQKYNVNRMKLLGAEVIEVPYGSQTLKDATSEAIRQWITNPDESHYLIGSVMGPHPYPMMVRDFQKVIGEEIKIQTQETLKRLPDAIIACIGGGSNAMGAFYPFIDDLDVELYGIEGAGKGPESNQHSLALNKGTEGILHGSRQYLLQDENRNILESYSISAGLDYPGVGPELCYLRDTGRIQNDYITDKEAIAACIELSRCEGIIPALESSHAIAYGMKLAKEMGSKRAIVINLSGHGGKDIEQIIQNLPNNKSKPSRRGHGYGGCFC